VLEEERIMARQFDVGSQTPRRLRRWAMRGAAVLVVLEVVYLIVGNLCIRTRVLERIVSSQPEQTSVSWESGATYLPGFVSLKGLSYRGQSMSGQVYLHLAEVDARISLTQLLFKRLRIRSAAGRDIDYRFRERIDYPCWTEATGEPFPGVPANVEDFPEIPGLQNPPDPRPEELYYPRGDTRPWTVEISNASIRGDIRAAYNGIRLDGEGSVAGGMTVVLDDSYAIDAAEVRLSPATLQVGPRVVTNDLDVGLDVAVKPFAGGCSDVVDVLDRITGKVTVAGRDSSGFTIDVAALGAFLPGQGVFSIESGSGELGGRLEVADGNLVSGDLDLVSDDIVIQHQGVELHGDLEIHGMLRERDLAARQVDVSGTTFRLDDITETGGTAKQKEKLEPWFCHLEFEEGVATLGRPMALDSRVRLTMHDTRPVLILLRKFTDELGWLSLTRNVKGIDGTMDLDFGTGFVSFSDLELTGENVEILGWVDIRNQTKSGRIYARHGARAAGMAFDEGGGRVVVIAPRRWFDSLQSLQSEGTARPVSEGPN
jgi:hypothetical protein